jgi:cation:H+ antiporter
MFSEFPAWTNAGMFVAAAAVVWFAGTRVARYADAIETRTRAGEALVGMLLLGFITALPEFGITVTASRAGNVALALNTLLGGMALNVAILAAADAAIRREALTAAVASSTPLLQGVLLVLLLAVVAGATVAGDRLVLGIGVWSWLILGIYLLCLVMIRNTRVRLNWVPHGLTAVERGGHKTRREDGSTLGRIVAKTMAGAAAILVAGYALAKTGDALAEQTGLGASFFGAVFLALSSSLPEISIVFSSVLIGRYAMAVSNIFGANLFGLALIFLSDALYDGDPVLAQAGRFATFAAVLGIAVTALFLAGLLERAHRMVGRMGIDSLIVLATYFGGVALLYRLR